MFLSAEEIAELTGRKSLIKQRDALIAMGIRFAIRPDRTCVVSRAHVESILGASEVASKKRKVEPNWDAI